MRRLLALLVLCLALAPGTWVRTKPGVLVSELVIRFVPLKTGPAPELGPFRLEKAWRVESRNQHFFGFSGLVPLGDGQLLALTDSGAMLRFSPPGVQAPPPAIRQLFDVNGPMKQGRDVEAVAVDVAAAKVWLALEFRNAIVRFDYRDGALEFDRAVQPPGMADWGNNTGPEALTRLHDGRFMALREGFSDWFGRRHHAGLLFARDPVEAPDATRFTLVGPEGYSPTDMAQLPDGRVLVLFRRLLWPFPARFGGAIALGDPAAIRAGRPWRVQMLARWAWGLPIDNFEGLAIEPGEKGRVIVWLISDDNRAALQDTILWKLTLDPADLPRPRKKARGVPARLRDQPR